MFNRRFVAFAKLHEIDADKKLTSAQCAEYMSWIGRHLTAYRKEHPEAFIGDHLRDQDAFTRYLESLQ